MPLFGSRKESGRAQRVQVLTRDYVVEGLCELSGQSLIRLLVLREATMRAATGSVPPAPRGSVWAVGENDEGLIAVAGDGERLAEYAVTGRHELPVDVFTGPYRVRGTLLAPDDDPAMLGNLGRLFLRDAVIDCLAPESTLGTWQAPAVLLFMRQLQGIVL